MLNLYFATPLNTYNEIGVPLILVDKDISIPKHITNRVKYKVLVEDKDILDMTLKETVSYALSIIFKRLSIAKVTFKVETKIKEEVAKLLSRGAIFFSDIGKILKTHYLKEAKDSYIIGAESYIVNTVCDIESMFLEHHIMKTRMSCGEESLYRTYNIDLLQIQDSIVLPKE